MPLTNKPNPARVKSDIRNSGVVGVHRALNGVKKAHYRIIKNWKEDKDKPEFTSKVEIKNNKIVGTVKMEGEEAEKAHVTVWTLLNWGTRIRFMELSEDWASKTKPGQLFSGPGGGKKIGINFEQQWPGIDERDFAGTVAEAQKNETDRQVKEGWSRGFTKAIGA